MNLWLRAEAANRKQRSDILREPWFGGKRRNPNIVTTS